MLFLEGLFAEDLKFEFVFVFDELLGNDEWSFKNDISVIKFLVFCAALARSALIGGSELLKKSLAASMLAFRLVELLVLPVLSSVAL